MSEREKRSARRPSVLNHFVLAGVLLGLVACASTGDPNAPRGPADEITPEQVEYYRNQGVRNAYEMLERTRSRWLRSARGSQSVSMGSPRTVVFLDHHMLAGIEELREVPLTNIRRIEWLSAAEADMLPHAGNINLSGAIVVYTIGDWDR